MADSTVSTDLHPIFTKDPEEWMQYINKQVLVCTEDGTEYVGWTYTIDPVSESIVLVSFEESKRNMNIIMGHSVSKISIICEDTDAHCQELDQLFRPEREMKLSPDEVKRRKSLLKSWLEKNRLPVKVSGPHNEMLTVADALVIQPPYGAEDCISTNEIILGRIQGLIKNMPDDHDKW